MIKIGRVGCLNIRTSSLSNAPMPHCFVCNLRVFARRFQHSHRCSTTAAVRAQHSIAKASANAEQKKTKKTYPKVDLGAVARVGAGVEAEVGARDLDLLVAADEGERLGVGAVALVAGCQREREGGRCLVCGALRREKWREGG